MGRASNQERVLYASAARTATPTGDSVPVIENPYHTGAHFVIDVTAVTSTPVITPTIEGLDSAGNAYSVLVGTDISATGTTVLKVGPGVGIISGGAASDYLPLRFRLTMTHADTDSITYSARVQMFGATGG